MPLDKLVLIIVCVIAAAGVTVWLGTLFVATNQLPIAGVALIPAALVVYVVWRVVADRITNTEDDHYDHIEK